MKEESQVTIVYFDLIKWLVTSHDGPSVADLTQISFMWETHPPFLWCGAIQSAKSFTNLCVMFM